MSVPAIEFKDGSIPIIDGMPWAVISRDREAYMLRPVGALVQPARFTHRELADLFSARRMTIFNQSRRFARPVRELAAVPEKWLPELNRRHEYVKACDHFFGRRAALAAELRREPSQPAAEWLMRPHGYLDNFRMRPEAGFARVIAIVSRYRRRNAPDAPASSRRRVLAQDLLAQPTPSSLRDWYKRWRDGERELAALEPRHDLKGNKETRLDPIVVDVIASTVMERWLARERPTVARVYDLIRAELDERRNQGRLGRFVPDPSLMAVHRWIRANIDEWTEVDGRFGADAAQMRCGKRASTLRTLRPLEIVEIDHTTLNLFCVEAPGETPKRPHLTVAIDRATRMVIGFHLSYDRPSANSVVTTLQMAFLEKRLEGLPVSQPWPVMGLPDTIVMDNGKELRADHLQNVAAALRIDLRYCKPRRPHLKGVVERFFGEVARDFLAFMPGKSFASVVERGDYPAERLARMSLGEVRTHFLRWVVDIYHMRRHDGLTGPGSKSPLRRWQDTASDGVRMPPSMDEFTIYLGRRYEMKVDENGVVLDHLIYQSDALYAIYSRPSNRISAREYRRYEVRLNPHDLSRIKLYDKDAKIWVEGFCENPIIAGLDQASWKRLCKLAQGRTPADELVDEKALLAARKRLDDDVYLRASRAEYPWAGAIFDPPTIEKPVKDYGSEPLRGTGDPHAGAPEQADAEAANTSTGGEKPEPAHMRAVHDDVEEAAHGIGAILSSDLE